MKSSTHPQEPPAREVSEIRFPRPGGEPGLWHRFALCGALLVLFLWPCFYNGRPFYYPDTTAYIRGADAGFSRVLHHSTVWTAEETENRPVDKRVSLNSISEKTVLAGRSIYYGAGLYFADLLGRLWPAPVVQAAVVLLSLALALAGLGIFTWRQFTLVSVVTAALTTAPFYTSLLMPDIFAAITILAAASLLAAGNRMPSWMLIAWSALLSASLLFHTTHVLIAFALLALSFPVLLFRRLLLSRRGAAVIAGALAVAVAGEVAFNWGVRKVVGAAPLRPPFLMARMIADGPGYRYLLANCGSSPLAVCRFLDKLPITDSDEFLWSRDPERGVFAVTDPSTQRQLANEQYRFALAVAAFDPWGEFRAALHDAAVQFRMIGLEEFQYDDGERVFLDAHVPPSYLTDMKATAAWKSGELPERFSVLTITVAALAAAWALILLLALRHSLGQSTPLLFAVIVFAGICWNAIFCGTLSTPHDRYQARVVWLLPATASVLTISAFRRSELRRLDPKRARLAAAGPDNPHPSS